MPDKRERSASQLESMQSDVNKNVDWLGNPWFGLAYILLLLILRGVAYLMTPPNKEEWGWTALNVAHAVVSFYALHWKRGSPVWEDQGEHIDRTVWEQIDNGVAFTDSKKFLMLVPFLLFIISVYSTSTNVHALAVNFAIVVVLLIPKLPQLEGVRLFGINKGPSDDE